MLTLCGLSPCVLDVIVSPAEVAELIKVPFGAGADSPVALYKFVCTYVCMYVCKKKRKVLSLEWKSVSCHRMIHVT